MNTASHNFTAPQERFPLSDEGRKAARKAIITRKAEWAQVRKDLGISSADLGANRLFEVADIMGIDLMAVTGGAETSAIPATRAEAPVAAPAPVAAQAENTPVQAPRQAVTHDGKQQALAALEALLSPTLDPAQIKALVADELAPFIGKIQPLIEKVEALTGMQPVVQVVDRDGAPVGRLDGLRHKNTELLLKAVSSRMAGGRAPNVWISGPAGSGKTFAAHQVADALGLSFGFHGAMTMAHELTGFVDAAGNYHETIFVKTYRNGGLVLLDEVDAGSSEALLALNAALANGTMSLPNGEMLERHKDFVCIAAGNTWGTGATADYVGRARIDAAFLDRFGVKIDWPYDADLEVKISGNARWAKRVQNARKAAAKNGLKVMITPRATEAGAALIAGGMTEVDAAKLTYLSGLSKEQAMMVDPEAAAE